jgi:hypothetical protein
MIGKDEVKVGNEPPYATQGTMLFFLEFRSRILLLPLVPENSLTLIFVVIKAIL